VKRAWLALVLVACGSSTPRDVAGKPNRSTPATPGTCPPSVVAQTGHCTEGDHCTTPEGVCDCAGYQGGIPPQEGVDYSHWQCGRTKHRTDGCPDRLVDGESCSGTPANCPAVQGTFCGQLFVCKNGVWDGARDTCAEIP
jgi:hypothetical protein